MFGKTADRASRCRATGGHAPQSRIGGLPRQIVFVQRRPLEDRFTRVCRPQPPRNAVTAPPNPLRMTIQLKLPVSSHLTAVDAYCVRARACVFGLGDAARKWSQ